MMQIGWGLIDGTESGAKLRNTFKNQACSLLLLNSYALATS